MYKARHGKYMVHNTVALTATDQLRQRVAWALAQIYVIGEVGPAGHRPYTYW